MFVANMGSTTVFDEVRLKYIICNIKPQVWVASRDSKTDEDILIYSVPLLVTGYNTNNHTVWHNIQNFCIETTSYNWIREFEANEDFRSMWLVLLRNYEGKNLENKHIVIANQAILLHPQQRLFYKNEHTFLFTKFNSCLQAAFVAITKYQNQVK